MSSKSHRSPAVEGGATPSAARAQSTGGAGNAATQARIQQLQGGGAGMGARVPISQGLLSMLGGSGVSVRADEPGLPEEDTYDYTAFEGPRWSKGEGDDDAVSPTDVDQGGLGDCYFHAAMAAVARANPQVIKDLIKDNGDGTYDVTLHMDVSGDWVPWAVDHVETVTPTFPTDEGGSLAYASNSAGTRDNGELWVMLLEKAYAQAMGGYGAIEGGNPGAAMELLGWDGHSSFSTSSKSADDIGAAIHEALENSKPVTAYTPDFAESSEDIQQTADAADIHGNHAYAPISVDVEAGTIDLQNPWSWGSRKEGVSLETFKKLFVSVQVGD